MYVRVQTNRNAVDAKCLDRLLEVDLPLLDLKALLGQLLSDVGGRHRAEQLTFFANAGGERQRDLLDLAGVFLRGCAASFLSCVKASLFLLDALAVARSCFVGKAAREKEISRITWRDFYDVARVSELFYCMSKNDFNGENTVKK
jgi:hypothetical protein